MFMMGKQVGFFEADTQRAEMIIQMGVHSMGQGTQMNEEREGRFRKQ